MIYLAFINFILENVILSKKYIQGVLTRRIIYGQRLFGVCGLRIYELVFVVYIQRIFIHIIRVPI